MRGEKSRNSELPWHAIRNSDWLSVIPELTLAERVTSEHAISSLNAMEMSSPGK